MTGTVPLALPVASGQPAFPPVAIAPPVPANSFLDVFQATYAIAQVGQGNDGPQQPLSHAGDPMPAEPAPAPTDRTIAAPTPAPPAPHAPIAVDAMVVAMASALAQPITKPPPPTPAEPIEQVSAISQSASQSALQFAPASALPVTATIVASPAKTLLVGKTPVRPKAEDPLVFAAVAIAADQSDSSAGPEPGATLNAAPQPVPSQPAPRIDTTALIVPRELAIDNSGAWLADIARDIARAADPATPLAFRLRPDALGELMIELTRRDDATSLRLTVDNEAARIALADGQQRLVAEARIHGVRIVETHILLSDHNAAQHQDRRQGDQYRPPPAPNGPQRTISTEIANHAAPETTDRYA